MVNEWKEKKNSSMVICVSFFFLLFPVSSRVVFIVVYLGGDRSDAVYRENEHRVERRAKKAKTKRMFGEMRNEFREVIFFLLSSF